ncbi:ribosomal L29e protein family-domain-containing protein [Desarmillaria tabescens]|uniref:60S ribosomal protein L29 n=1 Tax=Armillaria tabescens TaxID=1929756 RepID=A0AA39NM37_ARMTA|nr:ribosomal L29e protein family-domain-containing protein [Desarmillaria tabescens]KAK0468019.1 ribosomal L29e protein family-domain-containing protein [Desarmillaria tabescens]
MAKSKNHTNHNQNKKAHRNGIKKPQAGRTRSLKGCRCQIPPQRSLCSRWSEGHGQNKKLQQRRDMLTPALEIAAKLYVWWNDTSHGSDVGQSRASSICYAYADVMLLDSKQENSSKTSFLCEVLLSPTPVRRANDFYTNILTYAYQPLEFGEVNLLPPKVADVLQ